jgi:hypothetical protein
MNQKHTGETLKYVEPDLIDIGKLYISPSAQPSSITFSNTNDSTEILRITKDGVYANPDVTVDEAAKAVLDVMDSQIKVLVQKAVIAERQRIVNLLMLQREAAKGAHNYWQVAAQLIQADVASDT